MITQRHNPAYRHTCIFCLFFSAVAAVIFFFAVFTAVGLSFRIGQDKHVVQSLLDRGDTARIFAADNIFDLFRKVKLPFFYNFLILDDIDGNVVVDKCQHIQIHKINGTLYFHNILFTHFIAFCILDNGYAAVQLIQIQILIDIHAFAGLNMIQYKSLGNTSDC